MDLQLLPNVPSREQIDALERGLLQLQQVDLATAHAHGKGLYARTIFIPAGTTLTGAAHKFEHVNVCFGDITVWTEQGMKRLAGFNVIASKPGCKRAGFAHADTWWTTIHSIPDDVVDLGQIEDLLVEQADELQTRRLIA